MFTEFRCEILPQSYRCRGCPARGGLIVPHQRRRKWTIEMKVSASEKVRRFFSRFSYDDHVLVIINADPDSIASAMAVKRLLWRKVASVAISNINDIKRPDNLSMVRLLGVNLTHIREINENRFNRFVIVDSQPDHHECFAMFKPDVIIDHHPETCAVAPFSDIRPEYGATATIMTEYIRAAKIRPSVKLATALFYAIKTDTGDFERQTIIEDVRAFQFLYRHANINLVQKIEHAEIRLDFLKYFERALHDRCLRKGRIFAYLGDIVNPDICVIIADFFMRVETVKWSIIAGKYDKKLIVILRTDGIQSNAGKTAKKAFSNLGTAGGHKSMARAEVPLAEIKDHVDLRSNKMLLKWIMNRVEKSTGEKKQPSL